MHVQRQLSPAELLDAARRMHRRIGKALGAIDNGDDDELDDLAAALRTTLCFGKGDKLLLRLCNAYRVEPPTVQVRPSRSLKNEQLIARIGPIPSEPDAISEEDSALSFIDWVQSQAVQLPEVGRQSWEKVITAYANTFGSHISSTVPRLLDDIKVFHGPRGHMGGYLLRVAGGIAEHCLGIVLARIDDAEALASRRLHPHGVSIVIMTITDQWPVEFGFACSVKETVEILSMPISEGKRFRAIWSWDEDTGTGSLLTNSA